MIKPTLTPKQQEALDRLTARFKAAQNLELTKLTGENTLLKKKLHVSRWMLTALAVTTIYMAWQADHNAKTMRLPTSEPAAPNDITPVPVGVTSVSDWNKAVMKYHEPIWRNPPEPDSINHTIL